MKELTRIQKIQRDALILEKRILEKEIDKIEYLISGAANDKVKLMQEFKDLLDSNQGELRFTKEFELKVDELALKEKAIDSKIKEYQKIGLSKLIDMRIQANTEILEIDKAITALIS